MCKPSTAELDLMYLQEDPVIQLGPVDLFHLFVLEDLQDHEDLLDLLHPKMSHEKTNGNYFPLQLYKATKEKC